MFLVELVMQGVRRFKEPARLRFQSGFNFVAAGNEAGKTTAVDTVQRLLFPSGDAGRLSKFLPRQAPDASRGALVVYSGDGSYYRVIQDFSRQGVNLSRYDPATKEFILQHKDWASAAQFMAAMTAGISEDDFARIFFFRRGQSPGAQPGIPPAAEPRAFTPPAQTRAAAAPAGRSPAKEARLAELREALARAEKAADAEYRAQSGKLRLQEIGKKLGVLQEIDERIAELESKLAEMKGCENLPGDLSHLIEEHERAQSQRMMDLDRITQDISGVQSQIDTVPRLNIMADPLFIAGVVLAAGSVVAALFFLTTEQAAFFPIGVIASLGLVAGAWYKSSRKNAECAVLQKEIDELEAQRVEVEKSFEQGGAPILACLKATGLTSPAELKDLVENYRYYRSLLDEAKEQRERMASGASPEALRAEYDAQQKETAELDKAAHAVAHENIDAYSLRQDIERIEQELALSPQHAAPSWDFGGGEEDLAGGSGAAAAPAAAAPGGFFGELGTAIRVGGIEPDILIPAVVAACQRNLAAVTNGAYVRVDISPGSDPVVYDRNNVRLGAADLSHSTAETLYFCLRAGLVEALAGKLRLPFLLDDPAAGLDPARQKAAFQVLRTLGGKTQVILFTSNPAHRAQGDVAMELK